MERIAGVRRNSYRYLYGGFSYNRIGNSNNYRCSGRTGIYMGCPGRVRVDARGNIVVVGAHTHVADAAESERVAMQAEMRRRARETHISPREIFDAVSIDPRFVTAAVGISYESMRTAIFRERAKTRPRVPRTMEALGCVLEEYEPTKTFYQGIIRTTSGEVAIIIAAEEMMSGLNVAYEVHVDTTFRVLTNTFQARHVLTIHIRKMDTEFPAVFVLYGKQTKELYAKIWERLIELCPQMSENLTAIVSDFDVTLIASLRESFPATRIRGCWSHFCQAVLRRWKKIGDSRAPKTLLWMTMGLPLMAPERLTAGLEVIERSADSIASKFPFVLQFVQYLRRQWSPFAEFLSVGDSPVRAYDVDKSFDRHIVSMLGGGRTTIWAFLDNLKNLIRVEAVNWARVANAIAVRPRGRAQLQEDSRILEARAKLDSGRFTVEEFLKTCIRPNRRTAVENDEENETVNGPSVMDDVEDTDVETDESNDYNEDGYAGRVSADSVDQDSSSSVGGPQELQSVVCGVQECDEVTSEVNGPDPLQVDRAEASPPPIIEIIEVIEEIETASGPAYFQDPAEEMEILGI